MASKQLPESVMPRLDEENEEAKGVAPSALSMSVPPPSGTLICSQGDSMNIDIGTANRIFDQSLCKNRLQEFTQRVGLPLPDYHMMQTGPDALQFKCSVTVGDDTYVSSTTWTRKKAAEQEIAKCAWRDIFEKRVERGLSLIRMMDTFYKETLNEFAAKLHVLKPIYQSLKTQEIPPVFVSTLEFRGVSYTGGPSKTKKDAAQLVARDALISILGDSEVGLSLLELLISKAKLISSLQISKDPSRCATEPEQGYNSAVEGASCGQIVPRSDILIATSNEEQSKYAIASNSCALQTLSAPVHPLIQNHPATKIQTFANEGCHVTLASQVDNLVSPMHSLSPNHRTTPSLTCPHEGGEGISAFPTDGYVLPVPSLPQNPSISPVQVSANEGCQVTLASQENNLVSPMPSLLPNHITTPSLTCPHEGCKGISASPADGYVHLVPSVPQNPSIPLVQVSANEGCKLSSTSLAPQANNSILPDVPEKSTTPLQNVVDDSGKVTFVSQPHIFSTSVPLTVDCPVSLPSQYVGKRNHRNKKYKANKRARMANQTRNLICSAPTQ